MSLRRILFGIFFVLGLVYLLAPGPTSINDFSDLPNSLKSDEPGDTYQIPNVVAYFANTYRDFNTNFYKNDLAYLTKLPFGGPIRLNYPPEFAFTAIKDQTRSTYLEEYFYPLRYALFVNGYEPYLETGQQRFLGAVRIHVNSIQYETKTTLRFYPSPIWVRVVVWIGISISAVMLWKLGLSILKR